MRTRARDGSHSGPSANNTLRGTGHQPGAPGGVRPWAGALPEVLVSLRQLALAVLVMDQQAGRSGHNADPGYRQIAQLSSYGPQPPSLLGLGRKDQFKIVSSSEREVNRITILPAQP